LTVAKKGARLVTGVSGASDIFEILGIDLDSPLTRAEQCLEKYGLCYLSEEAFLKSGWARLIMSTRFTSAFNIIGPITRPCEQTNCIAKGVEISRNALGAGKTIEKLNQLLEFQGKQKCSS
jgi:anthranilate phosphoribosyltransferase